MIPAKKRRMDSSTEPRNSSVTEQVPYTAPFIGGDKMYDVFIIYSSNDRDIVINDIQPNLKNKNFSILYDDEFEAGKMVINNITSSIQKSKKILMVLTQEALDSPWCRFELLLALEKTQQTNIHSVVLLLKGLSPEKVSIIDVLRIAPKVEMDDQGRWIPEITEKLRVIEEKVKETEWYQENPNRMPCKIYEMVPEKCESLSGFSDDRIKYVGNLGKIQYQRAGNTRNLYYCLCEYPSVVSAIYQMEYNHLAELTKEDRRLQLARFYYTLNAILTQFSNCYGKARVLLYNEKKTKPSTVLLDAIKEDLKIKNTQDIDTRPLERLSSVDDSEPQNYKYDVYVSYLHSDADIADRILEYLRGQGMICYDSQDNTITNLLHALQDALQKSRYLVFILSKDSLHEDWFSFSCLEALHSSITDNKICVIPVLRGITSKHIPAALGWVTYIEAKEDNGYLERLYSTMACKDISIQVETLIPAGNVADGLAWAYVVNYLRFVLLGFTEKIDHQFEEKGIREHKCPKKLYILVPNSCNCPPSLEKADNRISKFHTYDAKYRNQTGTINRKYNFDIYKIEDANQKVYYFIGQYAAPVQCLSEMNESKIAGLRDEEMCNEAVRFCEITKQILESPAAGECANRCELIYYDDSSRLLADVMIEHIEKDSRKSTQ
ncbi:hypothetical protein KUTeg_012057 [Tegillarca granosa]|uniref:TIR domain-containing protein n=1 Tax=Tegillarca granosa TaxID=220873 RepID=A0ABQ9EYF3_TEGGR|nr:hypothetical protein KUTeg_012057 [Tegillarca granosa]